MAKKYNVILKLKDTSEAEKHKAARAIARVFKKDLHEAEKQITSDRVVLKSGLDKMTAKKLQTVLITQGMNIQLEESKGIPPWLIPMLVIDIVITVAVVWYFFFR